MFGEGRIILGEDREVVEEICSRKKAAVNSGLNHHRGSN